MSINVCDLIIPHHGRPFAGSDVASIQATATKTADGQHYIVSGVKKWYARRRDTLSLGNYNTTLYRITNGAFADYFSTAVRTGEAGMGGSRA